MIVEGAYPYVAGGVSSWVQQAITSMPEHDFVIITLVASRDDVREIKYNIPDNVCEIHEFYLQDDDYGKSNKRKKSLSSDEYEAFKTLFFGDDTNWDYIFKYFASQKVSLDQLLMSNDFLKMTEEFYNANYNRLVFSDFLWTLRSIYFPLFSVLASKLPEADIYHCLSTGYAGVIGAYGKFLYNKPLLISEHGIYTREREEEIIKAGWVAGTYKDLWIAQFRKFSDCAYRYADKVTSLYEGNKKLQVEFGCPEEKIIITPNGVDAAGFANVVGKDANDSYINIGAVLRVTPIKDVKTMISAFAMAKKQDDRLKLWIMGPMDEDEEYANECREMVSYMQIPDVEFTGRVNVKDYMGKMDFMVLSSISEGQPLVILEGFACHKPYITTNVGDCKGLIYGSFDDYGDAGIIVPVMNTVKLADAMVFLAGNDEVRLQMGENGYKRCKYYDKDKCYGAFRDIYSDLLGDITWQE